MKKVKIILSLIIMTIFLINQKQYYDTASIATQQISLLKSKISFLKELVLFPYSRQLPSIQEILPDEYSMEKCQQLQQKIISFPAENNDLQSNNGQSNNGQSNNGQSTDEQSNKEQGTDNRQDKTHSLKFAQFFIDEFGELLPHFGHRADELFFELEESLCERSVADIKAIYTLLKEKPLLYPQIKVHLVWQMQKLEPSFPKPEFFDAEFIKSINKEPDSMNTDWHHAAGLWFLSQGEFQKAVHHFSHIPWRHQLEPWYRSLTMYNVEKHNFTAAQKNLQEMKIAFPKADTTDLQEVLEAEKPASTTFVNQENT